MTSILVARRQLQTNRSSYPNAHANAKNSIQLAAAVAFTASTKIPPVFAYYKSSYSSSSSSLSSWSSSFVGTTSSSSSSRRRSSSRSSSKANSLRSLSSSSSSSSSDNYSYWKNNLNSPKHIMAPMVAQSDLPFRIMSRIYNTDLCYTQMIHSKNFIKSTLFQNSHLDVYRTGSGIGSGLGLGLGLGVERDKLHMTESGWNILHNLDWNTFEKECTFLHQNQSRRSLSSTSTSSIDTNEISNLIQTCRGDYKRYMESLSSSSQSSSSSSSSRGGNGCTQTQQYGTYYEALPTISSSESNSNSNTNTNSVSNKHPLIVQLAGHNPQVMTEAAQTILSLTNNNNNNNYNNNNNKNDSQHSGSIEHYNGPVSGIDINCGCPQAIAKKGNYGAYLMENDLGSICDTIRSLRDNLPHNVGVSVKLRIPPDYSSNSSSGRKVLKERMYRMMDAGVDLLTIHGRTIHEKKTKIRQCNWDAISDAVSIATEYSGSNERIPIIANGGIEQYRDVLECLGVTEANGVMSSEALLENPGLFSAQHEHQQSLTPKEVFQQQIQYAHEYLDLCILFPPLPGSLGKKGGSFNVIRSHLFKILYRYLEEQPDLRTALADSRNMVTIQSARDLINEMEKRYNDVMDIEYERLKQQGFLDGDKVVAQGEKLLWVDLKSSKNDSSWYRRHREAIKSNRMKIRGAQGDGNSLSSLSDEEKKIAIRERINKLKKQKMEKKEEDQQQQQVA